MINVDEWLEKIKSQTYHTTERDPKHPYGFVVGMMEGKGHVLGPYQTEEEANMHAMTFDPDKVTVVWSKFSQSNMVTRGVKHNLLDSGASLGEATKRMRHSVATD